MCGKIFIVALVFLNINFLFAQDTIPSPQEPDTTKVDSMQVDSMRIDTIVIRTLQDKIKYIPRGADLTNPVVSFKRTKPLEKKYRRFRIPSFWDKENKLGFNFSEVAFVNWNAGGNNSISGLVSAKFVRNYKFRYVQLNNNLDIRYGLNAQEGFKLRKTDDALRFSSTFAFRRDTISNWYYSASAEFRTQFSNGYKYPNRDKPISRFMAPGYALLGAGTSYIPEGKKFNLRLAPLTFKSTFVLDQTLANSGAFGVQKALVDEEGNIIKEGENVYLEFGFLVTNTWKSKIYKNMNLEHRIQLYSDYVKNFGNIDIDWELNLDLTVNKYVKTSIGTHVIYDHDIIFDEVKAADGTVTTPGKRKVQFKQMLGVGLTYDF
ncbi:MAG: DUF3078 domain-containing protein [Arenibacter sp.]|nr:DUF3078 domain-containing protein [Arenibacter sp.]